MWIEEPSSWTSSQPACREVYGQDHKRGRGASTASGDECVCTSCTSAECQVVVNQPFRHSQLLSETASGLSLEGVVAPLPWVTVFGSQNALVTRGSDSVPDGCQGGGTYRLSAVLCFLQIILHFPALCGCSMIPVILSAKDDSYLFFKVFPVMHNTRNLVKKYSSVKNKNSIARMNFQTPNKNIHQ